MLVLPEEFARACDTMTRRLQERPTQVMGAWPTGMMPYAEALGQGFFSVHGPDRAAAPDHTMALNTAPRRTVARESGGQPACFSSPRRFLPGSEGT